MLSSGVKEAVDRLAQQVRDRPSELPLAQIAELAGQDLNLTVEPGPSTTTIYSTPTPDKVLDVLSPREREVVTLLAAGFSNQQIASTLFVSLATIKSHMHQIFTKTAMTSRTEVVAAWYGGRRPFTAT